MTYPKWIAASFLYFTGQTQGVSSRRLRSETSIAQYLDGEKPTKRNRPDLRTGEIHAVDRPHQFDLPGSPGVIVQEHGVDGDGNCLFRAVSRQIYGTEDHHGMIRQESVNYIEAGRDFFRDFLPEAWPFDDYCRIIIS